ncbi:MAG: phosphatase PAP2/dual specificity phosphatase family protein [Acidobacteriia bacterium]|nr:phosphatase PAP2/dual specificity phosphatase family protein [Terriglobia bacterium]
MIATEVAVEPREPRPFLLSVVWLAALTPFFFLTYGFANWASSLRQNVPSLAFGWEHHIPFLAWTIVPYWSTDLFYAGALLLCRTRNELCTLGKRLIATQLLCVAGFLLVPLRFSFERPHPDGLLGRMFDALMSFDRPFNQAPSLHVALTAVLWVAYGPHFKGAKLWLSRVWFVVMALSTLTTYQHHFIDVPTGLWVGLFATTLFPENPPKAYAPSRDPQRFRLSLIYFIGSLSFVAAAYFVGGAAWLLLWPAGALVIVALIYLTGRAELFRKANGDIPAAAIMLLAPYVLAAWLNSRWHTRGQAIAQEICRGVWLGRIPRHAERDALGIASIVDLTAELPINRNGIAYCGVPMLDLLTPTVDQIDAAVRAIAELEPHRPTLVCCALGYSRSAGAVAAWLMAIGKVESIDSAIEVIRDKRPSIVVPERSGLLLAQWARMRTVR